MLQTVFYEHYGLDTWHRSCDIRLKGHTKSSCVASFFFVIEVNDTYTLQATCNQIPFVFVEKITRRYRLLLPCCCGFRTVIELKRKFASGLLVSFTLLGYVLLCLMDQLLNWWELGYL